ncbi:MAG: hypothetical protein H0X73_07995 [Chthoniobacterales bacterium]|nr:hypothetical protein [Chthoniobacterales bacterium]
MDHLRTLLTITARRAEAFALLCGAAAIVSMPLTGVNAGAQEVVLPEPRTQETTAPAPPANPRATIPPPQLIPPDILPMPDPSAPPGTAPDLPTVEQLDEELKPKPLSQASENYRLQIEWRKLRNRATNDPTVKAARTAAESARTDLERRQSLAKYFNIFFDKMIALGSPEMEGYLNDRRREHLRSLLQPRVRPMSYAAAAKSERATPATTALGSGLAARSPTPRPSLKRGP